MVKILRLQLRRLKREKAPPEAIAFVERGIARELSPHQPASPIEGLAIEIAPKARRLSHTSCTLDEAKQAVRKAAVKAKQTWKPTGDSSPDSWITTCAVNILRDDARSERRHTRHRAVLSGQMAWEMGFRSADQGESTYHEDDSDRYTARLMRENKGLINYTSAEDAASAGQLDDLCVSFARELRALDRKSLADGVEKGHERSIERALRLCPLI
jgi:DNA-directed RNA polymerase specialized sigma24 family protein